VEKIPLAEESPELTIEGIAEAAIASPIKKITDKEFETPSGDKRDYVSYAPYWYKDEQGNVTRKDGKINPDSLKYSDTETLRESRTKVLFVTLAALEADKSGDEEKRNVYRNYVENVLKAWFVDENTKMTPSLEYAQMKPGEKTGMFTGIIEGGSLMRFIDIAKVLKERDLISPEIEEGVKEWFSHYLEWLSTSEKGLKEKEWPNNHSTFYAIQIAQSADFLGREDLVKETLERCKLLIGAQIDKEGKMPAELKRHEGGVGYDYQLYNLYGLTRLAEIGDKYGVDLWNYKSENGTGIKEAFEFYVNDQLKNAGEKPFKRDRTGELYVAFRAAAKAYNEPSYFDLPTRYYKNELANKLTSDESGAWFH
jgi:hypothetical protein